MKKYILWVATMAPVLFLAASCRMGGIRGNGVMVTREMPVENFHSVSSGGFFDVHLVPGSSNAVKIAGEENIIPYVSVRVEDGVLKLNMRSGTSISTSRGIEVYVTSPEFRSVKVSGSGNVTSDGLIKNTAALELGVSGSGDMRLEVDAPRITGKVSGSGNMELRGLSRDCELRCSGSGDINCANLKAENAEVEVTGSGNASVFASTMLNVRVSGSGNVNYSGNPKVTSKVSGSGEVNKR
jgi:hypothetical protein